MATVMTGTAVINKDWLPYPWQLDVWEHINQLQQKGRLPHALLIDGEKGCGKQILVAGLAKKLQFQSAISLPIT